LSEGRGCIIIRAEWVILVQERGNKTKSSDIKMIDSESRKVIDLKRGDE
jgi:hypothetical protein